MKSLVLIASCLALFLSASVSQAQYGYGAQQVVVGGYGRQAVVGGYGGVARQRFAAQRFVYRPALRQRFVRQRVVVGGYGYAQQVIQPVYAAQVVRPQVVYTQPLVGGYAAGIIRAAVRPIVRPRAAVIVGGY